MDQHVFTDLVRLQMPDITEHLAELGGSGVELSLACTEWFLTLFASPCDKEVTVRIWDSIFLLGDEVRGVAQADWAAVATGFGS